MSNTRTVKDSMGEMEIPVDVLYAAQTQRAVNNFPISGKVMPENFIRALLRIKRAAAQVNAHLGVLEQPKASAIVAACESLEADARLMRHFPVDVFQTGSGTSTNMNANEVIATLGSESLDQPLSANDDVNFGQSSNDVIPSAIHFSAALALQDDLLPALRYLVNVTSDRAQNLAGFVKTGRTHLMDAMPVGLDQAVEAWAEQVRRDIASLESIHQDVCDLALGGTAVGTGINTHPDFAAGVCEILNAESGLNLRPASSRFALMASQDTAVALSGNLKTVAVSLMKISNDLRWMNSGPLSGLGEISLEALQPGSSIMPGKVNPVIPEAVAMVSAQVIGNDTTITIAGQSGNFELNVMLPVIASNLLESIELLSKAARLLGERAIATMVVNQENIERALSRNPILVTALNPVIGYAAAANIAKLAYETGQPVIEVALEETDLDRVTLERLLDPRRLTRGGL